LLHLFLLLKQGFELCPHLRHHPLVVLSVHEGKYTEKVMSMSTANVTLTANSDST
jgi:hypothetical protein